MEEATQKVLRVLWKDRRKIPLPEKVRKAVERLGLDVGDLDSFTQEVVEEAARRSLKALRGAWASLGTPPASPEAEEAEREAVEGRKVRVWYPVFWGDMMAKPVVQVLEGLDVPKADLLVPNKLPKFRVDSDGEFEFGIEVYCGLVEAEVKMRHLGQRPREGLFLKGELVYLEALDSRELEAISKGAKHLMPFFAAMGLEGPGGSLERALEKLSGLKRGEVGIEGEYVLAERAGRLFMLRGSLLGDPLLDVAFLAGERVTLSFPHGLEVSLRGHFTRRALVLDEVEFRWGGDVARLEWRNPFPSRVSEGDPVEKEIRALARAALYDPIGKISPRMRALLQVLEDHPEPLKALRSGEFYPQTVAGMFIELF
jgi:hypothetical protein